MTGPADVPPPLGVKVVKVQTAGEMKEAVAAALPADAAVFAAAVADWRVDNASGSKMKKDASGAAPALRFAENPDILATICASKQKPKLCIGFAAQTHDVVKLARAKRVRKGCDWIVANDVSGDVMGGDQNAVTIVTAEGEVSWPRADKRAIARKLAQKIGAYFS